MTSFSNKTPAEERRAAMQKKAGRALKEQEQIARARAEKTAQLRAIRLAREAATDQAAEKARAEKDSKPIRLPKTHRPQM